MDILTQMRFLEEEAHRHAFKDELGKYYWGKFLIYEYVYNAKHKEPYKRKY